MTKAARKNRDKKKVSADKLRSKLKLKHLAVKEKLSGAYPHVDRFFKSKNLDPGKIRDHSARVLGAGAMAGMLFLRPPSGMLALPSPKEIIEKFKDEKSIARVRASHRLLVNTLNSVLPKRPRPLTRQEEKFLEQIFANIAGVKTRATLEGEHLNTTYGYIGAEQHLRRYPGDTLLQHGKGEMLKEGIAPGLGAWGYFAYSKKEMTPYLEEVEKWYAVVQTLYLPDWNTRTRYLREWYKYRKVLIVDVDNGRAVVASVADSGPAAWTGKHFGGSPEVMHYLGGSRYKKGRVVLFFVDDPENKIPLGPVDYENVPIAGVIN